MWKIVSDLQHYNTTQKNACFEPEHFLWTPGYNNLSVGCYIKCSFPTCILQGYWYFFISFLQSASFQEILQGDFSRSHFWWTYVWPSAHIQWHWQSFPRKHKNYLNISEQTTNRQKQGQKIVWKEFWFRSFNLVRFFIWKKNKHLNIHPEFLFNFEWIKI